MLVVFEVAKGLIVGNNRRLDEMAWYLFRLLQCWKQKIRWNEAETFLRPKSSAGSCARQDIIKTFLFQDCALPEDAHPTVCLALLTDNSPWEYL